MKQFVFRKQSLERLTSPEQINDYVRVTTPGVWLLIGILVCLILAGIFWGITGRLEMQVPVEVPGAGPGETRVELVTEYVAPVEFLLPGKGKAHG